MKKKIVNAVIIAAVAAFTTSCSVNKLPNLKFPDCGEWKVPKLTD